MPPIGREIKVDSESEIDYPSCGADLFNFVLRVLHVGIILSFWDHLLFSDPLIIFFLTFFLTSFPPFESCVCMTYVLYVKNKTSPPKIILLMCKIFIYFSISREYDNQQFHISKSLKPYGAGDPL